MKHPFRCHGAAALAKTYRKLRPAFQKEGKGQYPALIAFPAQATLSLIFLHSVLDI